MFFLSTHTRPFFFIQDCFFHSKWTFHTGIESCNFGRVLRVVQAKEISLSSLFTKTIQSIYLHNDEGENCFAFGNERKKEDKTAGRNFISTISDLYTMGFSEFQIRKIRESSNKMTVEPLAAFSMKERESNLFPKVWTATSIVLFFGFQSPIFYIMWTVLLDALS